MIIRSTCNSDDARAAFPASDWLAGFRIGRRADPIAAEPDDSCTRTELSWPVRVMLLHHVRYYVSAASLPDHAVSAGATSFEAGTPGGLRRVAAPDHACAALISVAGNG